MITTLETIAAPVKQIQFPTVTVCPSEMAPPDYWSFLEKLLNAASWQSYYYLYQMYPMGTVVEKIHEHFEPLKSLIWDKVQDAVRSKTEEELIDLLWNPSDYMYDAEFISSLLWRHEETWQSLNNRVFNKFARQDPKEFFDSLILDDALKNNNYDLSARRSVLYTRCLSTPCS